MKVEHQIEFIVVDYLTVDENKSRVERKRNWNYFYWIKGYCKRFGHPGALYYLSLIERLKIRGDKKPGLSDLRESGSIEQDADSVLLIHRPEHYKIVKFDDGSSSHEKAMIIIGKQRNGQTGEIFIGLEKETSSFYNLNNRELEYSYQYEAIQEEIF